MSYLYCQSCGNKNSYFGAKPHFCGFCGVSCNVSKDQGKNPIKKGSGLIRVEEAQASEDETDINEVPVISQLDVDVDMGDFGMKTYAAHEIIGTQVPAQTEAQEKALQEEKGPGEGKGRQEK